MLIAVSDGCHGDDAPPEADGNVHEVVFDVELCKVDHGREDERADEHDEEEKHDLLRARSHRQVHDLQPAVVLHQLQDAHGSEDAGERHDAVRSEDVALAHEEEGAEDAHARQQEPGQHRHDVDDVEEGREEGALVFPRDELEEELQQEDASADVLDDAQRETRLRGEVHDELGVRLVGEVDRRSDRHLFAHGGVRLRADDSDRKQKQDEEEVSPDLKNHIKFTSV